MDTRGLRQAGGLVFAAAVLMWSAVAVVQASDTGATMKGKDSSAGLYERLGGMKGIDKLADQFVADLMMPAKADMEMSRPAMKGAAPSSGSGYGTTSNESKSTVSSGTKYEDTGNMMSGSHDHDAMMKKQAAAETQSTATSATVGMSAGPKMGMNGEHSMSKMGAMEKAENDAREILKQHVAARLCQASGGACKEPAAPLSEVRGKMSISNAQWSQAMNDLRTTLDERKISKTDQEEVMAPLTQMKREVSRATVSTPR